jgi:hypothetical protein
LSIINRLKFFHFLHFSATDTDRPVYQAIRRDQVRSILELGVGDGQRALRMIQVAAMDVPVAEVCFTGIDPFEAQQAPGEPSLPLKAAFRMLRETGARVRLLPGDLLDTLIQNANRLGQVDLLILSRHLPPEQLTQAWFFVPRLLHGRSLVYLEKQSGKGEVSLQPVMHQEIKTMAAAAMRRRAA